ncbi:MAG: LeoA/HP0731 family dynamin-like GTPase [Phormidesmis sp.]
MRLPCNAYLEILTLLSRRVEQERDRLRTKVKSIQLEVAAAISAESNALVQIIGTVTAEDFQQRNEEFEINIRQHCEKAERSFQRVAENAIDTIRVEVEGELQKALPQAFIARLEANNCTEEHTVKGRKSADSVRSAVKNLEWIADTAGGHLLNQATRGTLKTAKEGFAFRGVDVAGGNLHGAVQKIGKAVGYKFKPWEAVGMAKNIGNCARFIGPTLAFVNVAAEGYAVIEERNRDKELLNARRNIQKQFKAVAVDLKTQIEGQLQEFEQQIYDDIQFSITSARQEREATISGTNENYRKLASIRQALNSTLDDIRALVTPLF